MPRLVLLRHAKAGNPGGRDIDRPLAEVGVRQCGAVGRSLADYITGQSVALCSPAARTQQTWLEVSKYVVADLQVKTDKRIYEAAAGTLLELLQEQDADTAVLIGHSPGIPRLALALAASIDAAAETFLRSYPTSGWMVLESDLPFEDWEPGVGKVVAFGSGDLFAAS